MTSKPTSSAIHWSRTKNISDWKQKEGNFLLYDKDDKVNPPEPLRRGTKVEGKWQNGLRAPKLGPNQDKWEESFNDGPDIIFTKLDSKAQSSL